MINTSLIKSRMRRMGITQKEIAAAIGIAAPTVSQKINGVRPMNLEEARTIAKLLNIDPGEFGTVFFNRSSQLNQKEETVKYPRFEEERKRLGLSDEQVDFLFGMPHTMEKLGNGDAGAGALFKAMCIFHCSADYLLGLSNERNSTRNTQAVMQAPVK